MAKATDILKVAKKEIGYKESPTNSNKTKYGKEYGMNGQPWCCQWVWWVFKHANASKLFYEGKKVAYCPYVENWGKEKKLTVAKTKGEAGDIVLFQFDKDANADHIGIIEKKNSDGSYTCVEGNTSTTNNANGGQVMRRKRYASQIKCIIRPKYEKTIEETVADYPTLKMGSTGTYVKKLQKKLNSLKYNCGTADGVFGAKTLAAVKKFQKKKKLTVDGIVGKKTWTKLYK